MKKNHLPKQWGVLSPEDYLKKRDSKAGVSQLEQRLEQQKLDKATQAAEISDKADQVRAMAESYLNSIKESREQAARLDDAAKVKFQQAENTVILQAEKARAAAQAASAAAEGAARAESLADATKALEDTQAAYVTAETAHQAASVAMSEILQNISTTPVIKVEVDRIEYPWPTAIAADGSLIVGVRRHGRFGLQVCVETEENDGRIIRRLESASDVGLFEVERYTNTQGFKNLADGQTQWSFRDRGDFDELLWVALSQTKLKNTAAGKKDPSTDCCVKFRKRGIQMLTKSSLAKVLGPASANAQIRSVCQRDQITPPWEAGWVSEYHDAAKLEKDPVRRRALKDAQAKASNEGLPPQRIPKSDVKLNIAQNDDRIDALEAEMREMRRSLEVLTSILKDVMNPAATTAPASAA